MGSELERMSYHSLQAMSKQPMRPKAEWAIDSGHEGERNNCFSEIHLDGKKYRDKTTLASKTRFSRQCFGFQSRRFSLLVVYNIQPSSSSTNQNAALILDHQLDFTNTKYRYPRLMQRKHRQFRPVNMLFDPFSPISGPRTTFNKKFKFLFVKS